MNALAVPMGDGAMGDGDNHTTAWTYTPRAEDSPKTHYRVGESHMQGGLADRDAGHAMGSPRTNPAPGGNELSMEVL